MAQPIHYAAVGACFFGSSNTSNQCRTPAMIGFVVHGQRTPCCREHADFYLDSLLDIEKSVRPLLREDPPNAR